MDLVPQPTPPKYPEFAERLNSLLTDSGLAVKDLAAALDISAQMVGKYLRGESMPGAERLLKLAEVLRADLSVLMGGETPRAPGPKRPPLEFSYLTAEHIRPYTPPPGALRQSILFESEATPLPDDPTPRRSPLTPEVWQTVTRSASRVEALILHALNEYLDRSPLARAVNAAAVGEFRFRGPYGRASVDIAVTVDGKPALGIEIKSGIGGQIASLMGTALSWKLSTKGVPLLVVWIAPTTPTDRTRIGRVREDLIPLRHPEDDALGALIDSTWILPSDDPDPGLAGLLTRVSEILTGPKPD